MIDVLFAGDVALQKSFDSIFEDVFDDFSRYRRDSLLFFNLESPFRSGTNENHRKRPRVIAEVENEKSLERLNPSAVSLANNHVYDSCRDGVNLTKEILRKLNISFAGAGETQEDASVPVIVSRDGISIAIITVVDYDTNPSIDEKENFYVNYADANRTIDLIKKYKREVNHVFIYAHWGVEYIHMPSPRQREMAKTFVENGADLIIGTHSHVIQPFEYIKGTPVFYGLGNFFFPGFTFEGNVKKWNKSNNESLLVSIQVAKDQIKVADVQRTVLNGGRIRLRNGFIRLRLALWKAFIPAFQLGSLWHFLQFRLKLKHEITWLFVRIRRKLSLEAGRNA